MTLTLVSHALCPYVQRAAIVLHEKGAAFERRDVDLAHKPPWFLDLSPLGKTPVLLVEGEGGREAIFESAVICEYLDDTHSPRLHPQDALQRARHRAWMEFGSGVLNNIAAFYNAADEAQLLARRDELIARLAQLEAQLHKRTDEGPWFAGARFSIVDAVFAPVFRYFEVFDEIEDFGWFANTPLLARWRTALASRASVQAAVAPDYAQRLKQFLHERRSALSAHIKPTAAAAAPARRRDAPPAVPAPAADTARAEAGCAPAA